MDRLSRMAQMLRRDNDAAHKPEHVEGKEIFIPISGGSMRALYYGPASAVPAPLFVDIHGGAFIFASPEEDDFFCASLCRALNIAVISLDYPLAPEARFPRALEDIYAAVQALRAEHAAYGFDPENVSVGGHSAGGNLATALCMLAKRRGDLPLRCQVLDYPAVDMGGTIPIEEKHHDPAEVPQNVLNFAAECYADRETHETDPLCTPVLATQAQLAGLPPAILLTCERDSLRTEGERYAQALVGAGVEIVYKRFPQACHGFTIFPDALRDAGLRFLFEAIKRYV